MQLTRVLMRCLVLLLVVQIVISQELPFDIPVQLIGFPIIILAVRLSNFLKKLSYAVNPNTYRSRGSRRSEVPPLDVGEVNRKLIEEMGDNFCVYEDLCVQYAERLQRNGNLLLELQDAMRYYEEFPRGRPEFYTYSVMTGDILKSADLCRQIVKSGRSCNAMGSLANKPT